MDYGMIWRKICKELTEESNEITTGTGLWFKVTGDGDKLFIDRATENQPSCNLSGTRKLNMKDFMFVCSYYDRWLSGEKGIRHEVSRKSRNTAYVFGLLEKYAR